MSDLCLFTTCVAIEYCAHKHVKAIISHARATFSGDWAKDSASVESYASRV